MDAPMPRWHQRPQVISRTRLIYMAEWQAFRHNIKPETISTLHMWQQAKQLAELESSRCDSQQFAGTDRATAILGRLLRSMNLIGARVGLTFRFPATAAAYPIVCQEATQPGRPKARLPQAAQRH